MATTRREKTRALIAELNRISELPGNWDDNGAAQVSPRATGHYRAFLDSAPYIREDFTPIPEPDGGILVKWTGQVGDRKVPLTIRFTPDGKLELGLVSKDHQMGRSDFDVKRIEAFLLATG